MLNFPTPQFYSNIGGNQSFRFIPHVFINKLPASSDAIIKTNIILKPDQAWSKGYASPKSLSFLEKDENNGSDDYFSLNITGFYPYCHPLAVSLFTKMRSYRFLVLCLDNNMKLRLGGTLENPLKFKFSLASGSAAPERNGINFSFSGDILIPSPFLEKDHPLYLIEYPAIG